MRLVLGLLLFYLPIFAISLDQEMTRADMERTGVDQLNYSQKKALESWIDENFKLRDDRLPKKEEELYLSLNVDGGSRLQLSNGYVYEIDPNDWIYSKNWITPFPVKLSPSGKPKYPVKITNQQTGTSVNGMPIPEEAFIREERSKQVEKEMQKKPSPKIPEK